MSVDDSGLPGFAPNVPFTVGVMGDTHGRLWVQIELTDTATGGKFALAYDRVATKDLIDSLETSLRDLESRSN